MDLNLDEQLLVANFRKLSAEGRKKVLEVAASLTSAPAGDDSTEAGNQCVLPRKEARPETATDPLFTE